MPTDVHAEYASSIAPNEHPYLNDAWRPNTREYTATELRVIGRVPTDLNGLFVRNTENPLFEPIGRYHPFDGDGMLHAMRFDDGKVSYRNRFVQTDGLQAEREAGHALWAGIAENPKKSLRPGWGAQGSLKDSSSTDVVMHNARLITSFYQCGAGYELDPVSLETLGCAPWVPADGLSAHPKVDLRTGEMLFFNYSKSAPYQHYGVLDAQGQLAHYTPIALPGPRLPHDMAFTEHYAILADLPLFWDPDGLAKGYHANRYYPDLPTRFAIVPRYGGADEVRWFEADPTFVLHWGNAYESGDEVILDGYFQNNPMPQPLADAQANLPTDDPALKQIMAYVDLHSLQPRLHRWRFNLRTGAVSETHLDDRVLEFPTFNQLVAGQPYRYIYSATTQPGWFLFTGLYKHDLQTNQATSYQFGEGRFGGEAPFAPRDGASAEDDGYLVTFVTDMRENQSECVVLDAQDIAAGPICRIILPERISSGTHATWAASREFVS